MLRITNRLDQDQRNTEAALTLFLASPNGEPAHPFYSQSTLAHPATNFLVFFVLPSFASLPMKRCFAALGSTIENDAPNSLLSL